MRGAMAEKEPGRGLFEWLQTLMTAVVCMVLLFTFVGRVVRVDGRSMDPTLAHGELLLVWSMGYEPRAGDIVIASKTTAEPLEGEAVVKRAVALAGQTVELDYGDRPWRSPTFWSPWPCPKSRRCRGRGSRWRRIPCSCWGTTATAPPTAGTAGWAACTGTACWAGRWR